MSKTIAFILFLISVVSYGQETLLNEELINLSAANKVEFADGKNEIQNLAKLDIENQIPLLLLQGGINQEITPSDQKFEKKFNVYFFDYGCSAPSETVESIYNQIIFDFLYSKYGKIWMKEIRKDVPGFKEFKSRKR